jgi:hypothetical protein
VEKQIIEVVIEGAFLSQHDVEAILHTKCEVFPPTGYMSNVGSIRSFKMDNDLIIFYSFMCLNVRFPKRIHEID